VKDHIDKMREGLEKIKDGFSMMSGGPASFTLDCLLAAYIALTTKYVPFKVGQRVSVKNGFTVDTRTGWVYCAHFMVPTNRATVTHVSCDSTGQVRYDIEFDSETWIDGKGMVQPVIQKHVFCFFEHELQSYVEIKR
jgi:hypothetical protein